VFLIPDLILGLMTDPIPLDPMAPRPILDPMLDPMLGPMLGPMLDPMLSLGLMVDSILEPMLDSTLDRMLDLCSLPVPNSTATSLLDPIITREPPISRPISPRTWACIGLDVSGIR